MIHHAYLWEPDLQRWKWLVKVIGVTKLEILDQPHAGTSLARSELIYHDGGGSHPSRKPLKPGEVKGWKRIYRDNQ